MKWLKINELTARREDGAFSITRTSHGAMVAYTLWRHVDGGNEIVKTIREIAKSSTKARFIACEKLRAEAAAMEEPA
jgi:hypothetical protein